MAETGDMKPGDGRTVRCEDCLRTAAPSSAVAAPAIPVAHQPRNVERLSGIEQGFAVRLNVAAGAELARTQRLRPVPGPAHLEATDTGVAQRLLKHPGM